MCKHLIFLFVFLVDVSATMQLYQWPRFAGVKSGSSVTLSCENYAGTALTAVEWLKAVSPEKPRGQLKEDKKVRFGQHTGLLTLTQLEPEDSGIFYCKVNGTTGPGSEVQVHRLRDLDATVRRSNMKDVVIFLQGFLLGIFLLIPYFCYTQQKEKEETVYEEPDDDHTYEGLDIEYCGLYEDIPAYSQKDADEPCDMESPDQE